MEKSNMEYNEYQNGMIITSNQKNYYVLFINFENENCRLIGYYGLNGYRNGDINNPANYGQLLTLKDFPLKTELIKLNASEQDVIEYCK